MIGRNQIHQPSHSARQYRTENFIRPDDSVYHAYRFDLKTGAPLQGDTYGGCGVESHWARGTAWGIYGFALSYNHTWNAKYLQAALRIAQKFIAQLDAETVPLWDFKLPPDRRNLRDASAASIAVCRLQELLRHDPKNQSELVSIAAPHAPVLDRIFGNTGSKGTRIIQPKLCGMNWPQAPPLSEPQIPALLFRFTMMQPHRNDDDRFRKRVLGAFPRHASGGFLTFSLLAFASFAHSIALGQSNLPIPPTGNFGQEVRVEIVAAQVQVPWSLAFVPDGRLFFTERPGQVRVVEHGKLLADPALLVESVTVNVKMGLLGITAHPGFATNHFLYLAYNYTETNQFRLRVVRYREAQNKLTDPRTIIEGIPAFQNHTGCRLRFAPDGTLFVTTGDANDPPLAQRLNSLAGKILRLNDDGSIPADNPFVKASDARPEVWSFGHRNPQGIDFQPATGRVFAPEHGPDGGDEINLVEPGQNYGWPRIDHRATRPGMQPPLLEFSPAVGPSGATFYRGNAFPALKGNLLVGCLRGEGILRVQLDGTTVMACARLLHQKYGRIRDVVEGPDGYIYFTTSQFDPPEGTPRPDYDMVLRVVPKAAPPTGLPLAAEWKAAETNAASFDPGTLNSAVLITAYCVPCHGPGLRGGMQRGLLDGKREFARDDDGLRRVINGGLAEKGMPGFGAALKPAQIEALIAFIKQHEVDPAKVATNSLPPQSSGAKLSTPPQTSIYE
jgi:aldose sugar dehydrogenase